MINGYQRLKEKLTVALQALTECAEKGDETAQVALKDIEIMSRKIRTHKVLHIEGYAWCRECRKYLPVENFNKDRSRWNGLQSYCKECNKKLAKEYRRKVKCND